MVHFEDFRNLPTIMGIDQEIDVMSALMGMPTDYIDDHAAEFQTLIDDLANSHQISGYFDIRPENEENLLCFADWLEPMLTRFEIPDVTAKFFRFTYQDLLEAYPNLRALDAEDKPTRTNRDSTGSFGTESAKDLQAFRDMPRKMGGIC